MTAAKKPHAAKAATSEAKVKDEPQVEPDEPVEDLDVKEGAPKTESPEQPADPPKLHGPLTYTPATVSTSTPLTDATVSPTIPRLGELDTGVGSVPGTRAEIFVPPGTAYTITAPTEANDYGTATQMSNRVNTFEPDAQFGTVVPTPGY